MPSSPAPAPPPQPKPKPTGGGIGHPGETAHTGEPSAAPADERDLDEALKETFPASDPISPSAADRSAPLPPAAPPSPPRDDEGGPPAPGGGPAAWREP